MPQKIKELRQKIDEIDDQLLKLINRRAALAVQIGKEKSQKGLSNHFHVPHREREIIDRLQKNSRGPFPSDSIGPVFQEIFSGTLALEKPLKIAYLGPETTFTHQAAIKSFGHSAVFCPCNGIDTIFSQVEQGACDYGVVPVENSTEGIINQTLDSFVDSPLLICDEIKIEIRICLLSTNKDRKKIQTVYSHLQPLAQCRQWLRLNLPGAELVPVASTAQAAQEAARHKNSAALAGKLAAELHNLDIIEENIHDRPENYTRFLVIGKEKAKKTKRNKTSLMFSIKDQAGSLLKILQLFARNKINLTKIQSRPLRNRPWEYLFYLDFQGHIEDPKVTRVLHNLSKQSLFIRIMGSYPEED